jgi:hypothetical protein
MADLILIDYNDPTLTLGAIVRQPFQFTTSTLTVSTPNSLVSGSTEEIGGALYIVDSGNYPISNNFTSVNKYLEISLDGDDTATATWTTNPGTWNAGLNGFYNGSNKIIGFGIASAGTWYFHHYNIRRQIDIDSLNVLRNIILGGQVTAAGQITGNPVQSSSSITSATTIQAGTTIAHNLGIVARLSNFTAASTEGQVYTALNPLISTTVGNYIASGWVGTGASGLPISRIRRIDANTLNIVYSNGVIIASNGSGTAIGSIVEVTY